LNLALPSHQYSPKPDNLLKPRPETRSSPKAPVNKYIPPFQDNSDRQVAPQDVAPYLAVPQRPTSAVQYRGYSMLQHNE
jgi:hypothetical protein